MSEPAGTGRPEVAVSRRGAVAVLRLDRPDRCNTVSYRTLDALIAAFAEAETDDDVRAIVFTGSGDFFSAGTDISGNHGGMSAKGTESRPLEGRARDVGGLLSLRIFDSRKPVLAAVNGTAVGIGLTMILPMDIRIGASEGRYGLPMAKRGIVPESCATWFLPRLVGMGKATEWALTGELFDADEALTAGLFNRVVPAGDVFEATMEVAGRLAAATSPVSCALIRQMLWKQLGSPHPASANRLETKALLAMIPGPDLREGVEAFREKRAPQFTTRISRDLPEFYPWWDDPEDPVAPED